MIEKITPLKIFNGRDLLRAKRQIRRLEWILSQLPEKEKILISKMNLVLGRGNKVNTAEIKQFISLGYLIYKYESYILNATKAFLDYIKQLHKNINDIEKRKEIIKEKKKKKK